MTAPTKAEIADKRENDLGHAVALRFFSAYLSPRDKEKPVPQTHEEVATAYAELVDGWIFESIENARHAEAALMFVHSVLEWERITDMIEGGGPVLRETDLTYASVAMAELTRWMRPLALGEWAAQIQAARVAGDAA